ncbi:NO-inducible flavohemoprotein [Terrilactibacillus sp. S3-3]|nr:NO-inducible flavohemoprotein [Terrilactibacillus sp. S3-3]
MLSQKKLIDIVKSTVPVLEKYGVTITKHFYKRMFAEHPELLNIFNHANQEKGRQQTALANTVLAAAKHIDELEVLLPAVRQIGFKHRSLGVKPEQYPIIGENLLASIKEVLGDAATEDILSAWKEAYGEIAKVFMKVESDMYDEAAAMEGGWRDFKVFKVVKKEKESDLITSFYFQPKDGGQVPDYRPGQYITLRLLIPGDTYMVNRQYSLSKAADLRSFRISVKKESDHQPAGKVSNYLHDSIDVGDEVEISAPAGDFYLCDPAARRPINLISGGVGITPTMSMLQTIAEENPQREVHFVHAARNPQVQAFRPDVLSYMEKMPNAHACFVYDTGEAGPDAVIGRVNKALLKEKTNPAGDYYICGPVPFMHDITRDLEMLGVEKQSIHFEFFGPKIEWAEV